MKKLIFSLIFCLTATLAYAQKLQFESFSELEYDLSARTYERQDLNDTPCALVKVRIVGDGVTFTPAVIGDAEKHSNEYWVYLIKGARKLTIHHPDYLPLDIKFADYGIKRLESNKTYQLVLITPDTPSNEEGAEALAEKTKAEALVDTQESKLRTFNLYGEIGAHSDMVYNIHFGCYATIGANLKKFNLEASYQTLFINNIYTRDSYFYNGNNVLVGVYTPKKSCQSLLFKLGYQLPLTKRLTLTPQLGIKHIMLGNDADDDSDNELDINPNTTGVTIGTRLSLRLSRLIDVVFAPEYCIKIRNNESMQYYGNDIDQYEHFADHLSIKLGIAFNFPIKNKK